MKPVEVVAFGTLWDVLLGLGGLIILLYRQVEYAYQSQAATEVGGLLPGVEAPDIEIIGDRGEEPLRMPEADELAVLAFVSVGCDACVDLLKILRDRDVFKGRAVGLVNGDTPREFQALRKQMELEWLSHPPDVVRSYGVTATPTVYVLRGRTVLGSRVVSTKASLKALLAEARETDAALQSSARAEEAPVAGAVPV